MVELISAAENERKPSPDRGRHVSPVQQLGGRRPPPRKGEIRGGVSSCKSNSRLCVGNELDKESAQVGGTLCWGSWVSPLAPLPSSEGVRGGVRGEPPL